LIAELLFEFSVIVPAMPASDPPVWRVLAVDDVLPTPLYPGKPYALIECIKIKLLFFIIQIDNSTDNF
jgi:hypothetical protein